MEGFNSCYKGTMVGKKSKKRFIVGYGVITYHFGLANPYKKDDAQQLKFKEDLSLPKNLHAHFYCGKLMVELLGHVSKSQG
jgi:hypothetical protein